MRINKYLADCGVASRRGSEKILLEGRVKVNGKKVDSVNYALKEGDSVSVDGKTVMPSRKKYYIMLHKPKGYVTTLKDELGRKTVMELIDIKARLFPVGRLDYDTEGLLILTNDGALANVLTHPKHKISKTYVARVSGMVKEEERLLLEKGVLIDGKMTLPAAVTVLEGDVHKTKLEITIYQGQNRQVRRMLESLDKPVEFLKRTQIGEIRLGGLSRGQYRDLNKKELEYLMGLK